VVPVTALACGIASELDVARAACDRSGGSAILREQCMRSYDANNIFAKILRGELPAHKVYEDDETLAFMDIMPRCEGHTLVMPKNPARNLLDANPAQLSACMKTVQKVSLAIMKAFNADGITLQQFNEQAGGQVVFHLHFHVLPRREGVTLGPHTSKMEKPEVLAQNAEKIKRALAAQ
jgi:histidine triad (HIT) family protein